jgi:hypothetical protein
VDQKPSGKAAPSMRPAASARARTGADHRQESTTDRTDRRTDRTDRTDRRESADAVVIASIPISPARAERDAIAEAATAEAARRQGNDPLRLARRIAAALNAPGGGRPADLGFFWVTAVTTDGAIVVANSYGLAYIPDGVQLPEEVHMASADEAIPATERARWASYPVMAVQGWATHYDKKLRAVIGTEEQLANSDPGAAKVVLKPDDIPATGDMVGRSRLEVVDPGAADRLAETTDPRLIDLLPPAPVDAQPPADEESPTSEVREPEEEPAQRPSNLPPGIAELAKVLAQLPAAPATASRQDDQRPMLWFDVQKPLASSHPGRQDVHLRAFHTYAAHAQEVVLNEAHTAVDPGAQRAAVADWLYWKYLTELLAAALADAS